MHKSKSYVKLLESARDLFSEKWYESVSVAEICRNAGLSNGTFYKYFRDKEEIFLLLVNEIVSYYEKGFSSISGSTLDERLDKFLDTIVESGKGEYKKNISIYREAQFKYPEYEHHLRDLYSKGIMNVFERDTNQAEQLYISGMSRFVIIRYIFNELPYNKEDLKYLILKGIYEYDIKNFQSIFDEKDIIYPQIIEKDSTRTRLLRSGIELFGSKGYHKTDVHDITKNADYSVGTFYLYFESKESFLSEIVGLIGKLTRRFLTINLKEDLNRAENEVRGYYLFLRYFEENPEYYEIVREAEFVVNKDTNEYYDAFERGYVENLEGIKLDDKKLVANSLMGIGHYMGIEKIFLKRVKNVKNLLKDLSYCLNNGVRP